MNTQEGVNLLENKRIAIVGGGPGGLTLARLLQLKGADVTVYERDYSPSTRVQGATLDLHYESGLKALDNAGLLDAFKHAYRPGADKGRVVDTQANILYDDHGKDECNDFDNESFRPEIDRGDLRSLLLASLQADTVVWDSQLVQISPRLDAWQLTFKNGTTVVADLVVGADGAHSKVRPLLTSIQPFYAGTTIVQGNIADAATAAPTIHQLLQGGKLYTHTTGKFLHVSAKGDGSIDFYVSCRVDEDWLQTNGIDFADQQQLRAWLKQEFSGWAPVWFELFESVSLPLLIRPQYCVPFDQSWASQPSITLLGDAAHLMPPSGEGVNLAMLDALELSECLTSEQFATTQLALAAYEKPMLERGTEEAKVSMEGVEWMHTESANDKLVALFNE
ncbi:FAD-dependent oxidoreductase [Spirosoma pollinicola]|uniref:Flavin-dependent monooxygenase n=1 Tax=Spirosoma pollinicola TaxID=2057025 RepID=A0A2K8Z9Y8_9BACT|nr:NAD(P)/FAD-dependent oxidoreductase [Spirosoma pollinicola]AUD06681.1 2-polyprenyl-6-methoxyphenol hydroxylase [Spirosoma pollinicola]